MSLDPNISESSVMFDDEDHSKSSFRISVCLKRYFTDFRSRCYIFVERNRRVRWLERRLGQLFAIPGRYCLCSNGHFLPPFEPLALLQPDDSLEVIPISEEAYKEVSQNDDSLPTYEPNKEENRKGVSATKPHPQTSNSFTIPKPSQISVQVQATKIYNSEDESDVSIIKNNNNNNDNDIDNVDGKMTSKKVINGDADTNNTASTLEELKYRALNLLEKQYKSQHSRVGVVDEPPLKRTRRRVRKRTRRSKDTGDTSIEPQDNNTPFSSESQTVECSFSGQIDLTPTVAEHEASPATQEVARNQAVCSRKPRVVRPLTVEN